ncbi:divergent polysaccharide deacetylase family protein [Hydrogenimonas sp.]
MAKRKPSTKTASRTARKSTRRRKPSTSSRLKLYLLGGTVAALVLAILLGMAGWIGYEMGQQKAMKRCEKRVVDVQRDLEALRKKLNRPPRAQHKPAPPAPRPKKAQKPSEVRDYEAAGGAESAAKAPAKERVEAGRPKLAIIIDDVAYASQLRAIRALPWHITPSIFPPTPRHPDTPKIAAKLDHYMIHLPMEAMRYNNPEDDTLTTESSAAEIDLRVRRLRHWFPHARFINNHTGSRFTADMASMERFFPVAKRYGFVFVDSRTTPKTVVPELCKRYKLPYIARDIFLDNEPDTAYIQNQLKKAVRLAKAHGYAIAIGHPHGSTLKALAASKKILKGVDVVYIDELYDALR